MKSKRKILSLAVALSTIFSVVGCGENNIKNSKSTESIKSSENNPKNSETSEENTIQITIGSMEFSSDLTNIINSFNKSNSQYEIVIKDYHDADATVTDMQNNIKIDLVSGKAPDIIICNDSSFYHTLSSKGAFMDISDYISENRIEILPNIIDVCTENNGDIYRLPFGFNVLCGVCKEEYGTDHTEIYNYKKMQNVFENLDSDTIFTTDMKSAVFATKEAIITDFIDLKNFKSSFDSPEFVNALEFYKQLQYTDYDFIIDDTAYVNDKAHILYATLGNISEIYRIKNHIFKDTDIAITPPENAKINLYSSISILNSSSEDVKQGAFEFLTYALSDEFINTTTPIYFPVTKSGFKISLESEFNIFYGKEEEKVKLNEEEKKYISDYIQKVNHEITYDTTVKDIFMEETKAYLDDASCSAEECGNNINQRVQLYLDEQKN